MQTMSRRSLKTSTGAPACSSGFVDVRGPQLHPGGPRFGIFSGEMTFLSLSLPSNEAFRSSNPASSDHSSSQSIGFSFPALFADHIDTSPPPSPPAAHFPFPTISLSLSTSSHLFSRPSTHQQRAKEPFALVTASPPRGTEFDPPFPCISRRTLLATNRGPACVLPEASASVQRGRCLKGGRILPLCDSPTRKTRVSHLPKPLSAFRSAAPRNSHSPRFQCIFFVSAASRSSATRRRFPFSRLLLSLSLLPLLTTMSSSLRVPSPLPPRPRRTVDVSVRKSRLDISSRLGKFIFGSLFDKCSTSSNRSLCSASWAWPRLTTTSTATVVRLSPLLPPFLVSSSPHLVSESPLTLPTPVDADGHRSWRYDSCKEGWGDCTLVTIPLSVSTPLGLKPTECGVVTLDWSDGAVKEDSGITWSLYGASLSLPSLHHRILTAISPN